ncbi:uncharacterized protein LOC102719036 [Oryza brachyantha]|uniref:uncharacterized protein LOC102719036 n=1 Tax=Oryza brachyantha TaxID=4533 RepID=UPI001AD9A25F|nr:uncharacterized protein LOC102719036 [Oryza brachyantha]
MVTTTTRARNPTSPFPSSSSSSPLAMAAGPPPAGFFSFLKHGVLVPARGRGIFLPLLALTAALAGALLLANSLAVQPRAVDVLLDADALSRADPASAAYPKLVRRFRHDLRSLLVDAASCVAAAVVAGSAIKIATVFAAVAAFSVSGDGDGGGERRATVSGFLAAAKGNLWGPVVTIAFGYILEVVCVAAIVAMAMLMVPLLEYSLLLLFLDAMAVLLAALFLVYLTVVCAVALAVSAAEPGKRGAGAVSRAWRLMSGKNAQAVVYVVATFALAAAVSPVYTLALRWWPRSAPAGAAAGVAYVLLLGAVEVFSVAAVTAYYFECRESKQAEEDMAVGHHYTKLPNGDEANI